MKKAMGTARLAPGRPAPPFQARDANGAPVTLQDYAGKVVLLDFWLSQWKPWVRELPALVSAYTGYHAHGFEILGFCQDRDKAAAQALLTRSGANWPQLTPHANIWKAYGVYGEAHNVLIDRNGVIVGQDLHGAELLQAIKGALKR
ncbi:MAG: TlpA family protein disulfide reductase [Spartobacteria bacterium]|nr:TlpA family protein disulfide reductase [Spartobacteria bacterium]